MKKFSQLLILIVFISSISCQDEIIEGEQTIDCPEMLYFENSNELIEEINHVISLSLDEKNNWEKNRGFKSMGVAIDRFHEAIDPECFIDVEQVYEFVERNNKYIELVGIGEEFSVESKFRNNPYKYIINEESIYQVGDRIYKWLDDYKISVSIENIDKIRGIDDKNIEAFLVDDEVAIEKSNDIVLKSSPTCGTGSSAQSSEIKIGTRKYKTEVELELYHEHNYNFTGTSVLAVFTVKSRVRTIGWWGHKTGIYADVEWIANFKSQFAENNMNETYTDEEWSGTKFENNVKSIICGNYWNVAQWSSEPNAKFVSYRAKGWTYVTGASIEISCQ